MPILIARIKTSQTTAPQFSPEKDGEKALGFLAPQGPNR